MAFAPQQLARGGLSGSKERSQRFLRGSAAPSTSGGASSPQAPREAHVEPTDPLVLQADEFLRTGGADGFGLRRSQPHGPTMRALLHEYTQGATLAATDENGEHPLHPMSPTERRTRSRQPGHHGAELLLHGGVAGADDGGGGGRSHLLDSLLRHVELERLPQIRDDFLQRDSKVNAREFVAIMCAHLGISGGAPQVSAELRELHAELVSKDSSSGFRLEPVTPRGDTFITDDLHDSRSLRHSAGGTISWNQFAQMLVDKGIVGDVFNNFNIVKVLSNIDLEKIAPLRDQFHIYRNALSLERFVVIMKAEFNQIFELTQLFALHEEERHLVAQLVGLYEMIDFNGTGTMTWEDFTNFLVDQGMSADNQLHTEVHFSVSSLRDTISHAAYCEKVRYFRHYDRIGYVEQGSKSLKLCTPDLVPVAEIKDFQQPPVCMEYIDKFQYVAVASSDLTLSFFDADSNLKRVRTIETKSAQLVMCWSEVAQVLFSADHEGRIFAWDMAVVKAGTGKAIEAGQPEPSRDFLKEDITRQDTAMRHSEAAEEGSKAPHSARGPRPRPSSRAKSAGARHGGSSIVMMLLELPVLAQMASCGVDKNIMIWDVFTGICKKILKGHEMGVRCMAFVTSKKFLVTGGYDYNLFVWNPYVGKSIHAIQGHPAPIVGIEVIHANQIVSADSEGFMKTWDLGTFQCLQTIIVDEVLTMRAFISAPTQRRVFAVDRKFIAYDYQNTGKADQTDEAPIIKAIFHPRLKVFITACTTHLRIWDAVSGSMKCMIPHREADITDFCVDDNGRKIFIADHMGEVFVHNTETGCFIKKLTPHASEISGIRYCHGDKNVLTVSWDRSVVVHDESEQGPKVWRKATNVHAGDITCVAMSRHLGLVATGSTDCVVALREYERLRVVATLIGHKCDITTVCFIEPFALLASADVGGNVALWAVPAPSGSQHRFVNQVLTRFVNMQSLDRSATVNCLEPVYEEDAAAAPAAAARRLTLFTGDEDGDIRCWDLSQLLSAAELEPCAPKADWDHRRKDPPGDGETAARSAARLAVAAETPELQIRLQQPVVRQRCSWSGHSDSVRSLKVYAKPACVVTAGYDHMVKIWELGGTLVAVLRSYGVTPWVFPIQADMTGIDDETLDRVLTKVREMEEDLRRSSGRRGEGGGALAKVWNPPGAALPEIP